MAFTTTTPAPHQNNVLEGHEHLLSDESKAILKEHGLTVDIAQQQDPHKLSLPIPFVGIKDLIPTFPNCSYVADSEIGATDQETVDNILNNIAANAEEGAEPIACHWVVYFCEGNGRKIYTENKALAEALDGKLAGVAYATEKQAKSLGSTLESAAKFIGSQFAVAAMFANDELLQIIWRKDGKPLELDVVVVKDANYIDRKIRNKTRNISLRRPTEPLDFSQFVWV